MVIANHYYKDSVKEVIDGVKALERGQVIVSCFIAVIFFVLEGYIISNMSKHINPDFKWKTGFKIAYLCEFFRVLTLGSGSGVIAIYYLQKNKVSPAKGTGLTVMQFGIKKVAIFITGIIGYLYLILDSDTNVIIRDYNIYVLFGAIFTFLVAIFMMGLAFSRKLNGLVNMIIDKLMIKFSKKSNMFEKWKNEANQLNETGLYIIHHPEILYKNLLADCMKLIAIYSIPSYILIGNCSATFSECVMLICVINMVDIIIPVPSGIGSFEFLFVMFMESFANSTDALTAVLVYRFATWIVPFFVGMFIWIIDKIREIKGLVVE